MGQTRSRGRDGDNRAAPTESPATRPAQRTRQQARGRTGKGNRCGRRVTPRHVSSTQPTRGGEGRKGSYQRPRNGRERAGPRGRQRRTSDFVLLTRILTENAFQFNSRFSRNLLPRSATHSQKGLRFPGRRTLSTGKPNPCCGVILGSRGGRTEKRKKTEKTLHSRAGPDGEF